MEKILKYFLEFPEMKHQHRIQFFTDHVFRAYIDEYTPGSEMDEEDLIHSLLFGKEADSTQEVEDTKDDDLIHSQLFEDGNAQ